MLSKSQARLFFILGTVLFSLVFLFLTVDTVRKVPAQTKQQNITEAVHRGKKFGKKTIAWVAIPYWVKVHITPQN
jgi:nitric oxide reductase subunit C